MLFKRKKKSPAIIIIDKEWGFWALSRWEYISGRIKIHITSQVCFYWKLLSLIWYVISQILSSTLFTFKNVIMCSTEPSNDFVFCLTLWNTVARRVWSPGETIVSAASAGCPPSSYAKSAVFLVKVSYSNFTAITVFLLFSLCPQDILRGVLLNALWSWSCSGAIW